MSKRFGRKQKRRLKAMINHLQNEVEAKPTLSDGSLGWIVRYIERVMGTTGVVLSDGVQCGPDCFKGAKAGDLWLVKYERSLSNFGSINKAKLIQRGGVDV